MRLFITLFILFFSPLFLSQSQAAPDIPNSTPRKTSVKSVIESDHKKSKSAKRKKSSSTPIKKTSSRTQHSTPALVRKGLKKSHAVSNIKQVSPRIRLTSGLKNKMGAGKTEKPDNKGLPLSAAHKKRYQHARLTAINKLMSQVGKPYRWGGSSPLTGFDCSGLVYFAYKDVVNIPIPRTANAMYHLRDAAPIKKNELESGDLVFFRINSRGTADHVGVYLGDGKFIQSPRTGADIRISKLNEDYWQEHYLGARRMVTPQTMR
ncbi:C40 family peptidase [Brenneria izbisi]|uniref:NlpC/P60 family protein n=1 Tax=Brenneria izbisi TaxID=2939450 RepID=A0AA42C1L9_9GAMM|nr:C40 family peptidase [Brenneria izbisi]MCV9877628.1 NlpC/P60 family protein [Brenneria izbisi]MCV9880807.1 NlpC/P60 family protein [Brenneria izbisi]